MSNRLFYTFLLVAFIFLQTMGNKIQPIDKNSLFADGRWIKIETSSTGIHKIHFSWLQSLGFSHPDKLKLYGSRNESMAYGNSHNGTNRPVRIPVQRFTDPSGDESFLFYVQGPVQWNFDPVSGGYARSVNQAARGKSWFYLTEDAGIPLAFPQAGQIAALPDKIVTGYDDLALWEEENINLLESGSRWFSSLLSGGNILTKTFQFPDRQENEAVNILAYAAARSSSGSGMELSANGAVLGSRAFNPVQNGSDQEFATLDSIKATKILPGADIRLSLKFNGAPTDQCWFDYTIIQFRRSLQYRGSPLFFRDSRSIGENKIIEYQVNGAKSDLQLWEVTDPLSPIQIAFQVVNGQLVFRANGDQLRSYLLFDPKLQYPGMAKKEEVKNEDLLRTQSVEYLIITPSQFLDQANRLASFHRLNDGMKVSVATTESVFNEFSGGYPDISALRDFVSYIYHQNLTSTGSTLKYLLLFGKGTCDPVHEPSENNPNWIPTFQSDNSLHPIASYVTDDFFGRMEEGENDQSGSMDIGIGRIPAVSLGEATMAVDKIIHYHEAATLGDWRNNLSFIGDDEDNNIHVSDSETLVEMVNKSNPEYRTSAIYLDAYPQILTPEERYPAVNEAIKRSVHAGDLIVNYIGHASEDGLAHERILTTKEIETWTNKDRLPLFVTATCEFSRWDMIMKRSAGERLLFHPGGGAIALLSATRLVYSASNFEINKSFFQHAFDKDKNGEPPRLGDLIRLVKNENSGSINTLKFCLLGDPALRLNYPKYQCRNTEINHQNINQFSEVLSPLSLVSIGGEIQNSSGVLMGQLSGSLSVTVYDQPTGKKTLGNGGLPPFTYSERDNILFNGVVPVKAGTFSYSFVVPKDVNFNREAGLIRYYFTNGTVDANGSFGDIHFNGTGTIPATDHTGPEVRLYLENEKFSEGGTVSANPLLMVYLNDESGLNTSGGGIGHDMLLELDGETSNPVLLNDFYHTDPGSWKSGSIYYPLSTLANGSHTLKLKVWDNANNSTTAIIRFIVGNELIISNIHNFPNPFSDQTGFVITHNRYNEWVDVSLEIMDLTGRKVESSSQRLVSAGYEVKDLFWVPRKRSSAQENGVYIYRITVTDKEGQRASKSGRIIWKK